MDEKTDNGGASCKQGSSSVLPQKKRGKSKRNLVDPSLKNPVNIPLSSSEFSERELPSELFRSLVLAPLVVEASNIQRRKDFKLPTKSDDRLAFQLLELLYSTVHTIFRNAIKKIAEYGYKEDVAEKAISRSGLYEGGKDLVSNVVTDALDSLRKGKAGDISTVVFDRQQLVEYTVLEMITVLTEAKPSMSSLEAMWCLLMFDMNISAACEAEGDISQNFGCKEVSGENSSDSTPQLMSETQNPETILPSPNEFNVSKPSFPSSQNHLPETLNSESFPNLPHSKNPLAYEGMAPEKESFASVAASGDYVPVASVSEGKSEIVRKGRSKKELAALRKKSSNMEKYRTYGKGASRAGKLPAIGGFVVDKRIKSPSELPGVQRENASSKIISEAGAFADESHRVLTNSSSALIATDKTETLPTEGTKSAVGTTNTELSRSSFLGNKPAPKSDGRTWVSSKPPDNDAERKPAPKAEGTTLMSSKSTDYCAGIPYDESQGKYIPQDEKDELILKLVPRLQQLQNELHGWTQWANQKVMEVARRLSRDQAELKSLRREKEEAEQLNRENQVMEENTMKKLSEMETALSNATHQFLDANSIEQKLMAKHSLLKMEMEAAKIEAEKSAANCREAMEREQKALKDVQSWDGERSLLQKELASEKRKATELQRKVGKAKNIYSQTEMTWKQEIMEKEKLLSQAASIRKERECLEDAGKMEARKVKLTAEKDMEKYEEEVKNLEKELSELKMKLDSSKIAALRKGTVDGNFDIKDYSGSSGLKRESECVMCLSEEKIVVFIPCAHQVLCAKCNELHQKQGMKDCPACRTPIICRICAHFAKP
ncbi:hypothetical protein DITRI_Ditri13aG0085900 [Diplodiscus trichospermus]